MLVVIDKDSLYTYTRGVTPTHEQPLELIGVLDAIDGVHLTLDGYRHATLILIVDARAKQFKCIKDRHDLFNTKIIYDMKDLKWMLGDYPGHVWGWEETSEVYPEK